MAKHTKPDRSLDRSPVRPLDAPASAPASSPEQIDRVAIPLTPGGLPDFERMRTATRDKLKTIVSSPAVQKHFGIGEASSHATAIPDVLLDSVLQTIGALSAAIVERAYGCTREQAETMYYSEREKEAIRPPLRNVLDKHGSALLSKWGDEIALGAVLASTFAQKAATIKKAVRPLAAVVNHPSSEMPVNEAKESEGEIG